MPDRRPAGVLLALAVVAMAAASPSPSRAAEDVTAAQLRELARRAEHEPAARQELASVRRVDGRPVDLSVALAGADEDEQRARLRTLAAGGDGPPAAADATADARDDARRILEGRRYNPAQPPRPFRGVLRRLGEWLEPLGRPFVQLAERFDVPWWARVPFALAVLVVAVAVALRLVRRRTAAAFDSSGEARRRRRLDPDALERDAEEAERRGDLDAAVRLRFRAGLVRLDAAGAVRLRPSLTTGELRRQLASETLHDLTVTFEAVAYAGEPAEPDDVAAARRDWPRVLEEVAGK